MAGLADLPSNLQSWPRVKSSLLDLYDYLTGHNTSLQGACTMLHAIGTSSDEPESRCNAAQLFDLDRSPHRSMGTALPSTSAWYHLMKFIERQGIGECDHFLHYTLPGVIQLALAVEDFGPKEKERWSLQQSDTPVVIPRQFLCCVLACRFLLLCPGSNRLSSLFKQLSTLPSVGLQVQSVLDYFDWVVKEGLEVKGQLVLHRKVLHLPVTLVDLCDCDIELCPLTLLTEDQSESWEYDDDEDRIEVHFCSGQPIDGMEDSGLVRMYPELLAMGGREDGLSEDEAFVLSGLETFLSLRHQAADGLEMDEEEVEGWGLEQRGSKTVENVIVFGGSKSCWLGDGRLLEDGQAEMWQGHARSSSSPDTLQQTLNLTFLGLSECKEGRHCVTNTMWNRMSACGDGESKVVSDELSYTSDKHSLQQEIFGIDDVDDDDGHGGAIDRQLRLEQLQLERQQQQQQHVQCPVENSTPLHQQPRERGIPSISTSVTLPSTSPSSSLLSPPALATASSSSSSSRLPHSSCADSFVQALSSPSSCFHPSLSDNLSGASTTMDKKQYFPTRHTHPCRTAMPSSWDTSTTTSPQILSQSPASSLPSNASNCLAMSEQNRTGFPKLEAGLRNHQLNKNDERTKQAVSQKMCQLLTDNLAASSALSSPPTASSSQISLSNRNYNNDPLYSRYLLHDILGNLTKSNSSPGAFSSTAAGGCSYSSAQGNALSSSMSRYPPFLPKNSDDDVCDENCHLHYHHAIPIQIPPPSSSSPASSLPFCDNKTSLEETKSLDTAADKSNQASFPAAQSEDCALNTISSSNSISTMPVISSPTQATLLSTSVLAPPLPAVNIARAFQSCTTTISTAASTSFIALPPPLLIKLPTTTATNTVESTSHSIKLSTPPGNDGNCSPENNKNLTISSSHSITASNITTGRRSPRHHHHHHLHRRQRQHSQEQHPQPSSIHLEPPLLSSSPQSHSSSVNNSPNSSFTLPDPALIRNSNFTNSSDVEVTADFFIPGIDDQHQHRPHTSSSASHNICSISGSAACVESQDYAYQCLPPGTNGSRDNLHSQLQELISSSSSSSGSGLPLGQCFPWSSSGCSQWGSRSGSISSHGTNGSGSSNDFMELWYNLRRRSSQMSDASRTSSSSKHSSDFSTDLEEISETFSKHAHEVIKEEEGGTLALLANYASQFVNTAADIDKIKGSELKQGVDGDTIDGNDASGVEADTQTDGCQNYKHVLFGGEKKELQENNRNESQEERITSKAVGTDNQEKVEEESSFGDSAGELKGKGVGENAPAKLSNRLEQVGKSDDDDDGTQTFPRDGSLLETGLAQRDVTENLYVDVSVNTSMFSSPADSAFHSGIFSPSPTPSGAVVKCQETAILQETSLNPKSGDDCSSSSKSSDSHMLKQSLPSPNITFSPTHCVQTVQLTEEKHPSSPGSSCFAVLESKVVYLEEKEAKSKKQQPSANLPHLGVGSSLFPSSESSPPKDNQNQSQQLKSSPPKSMSPLSSPSSFSSSSFRQSSNLSSRHIPSGVHKSPSPSSQQYSTRLQRQSLPKTRATQSTPSTAAKSGPSQPSSKGLHNRTNPSQSLATSQPDTTTILPHKPALKSKIASRHKMHVDSSSSQHSNYVNVSHLPKPKTSPKSSTGHQAKLTPTLDSSPKKLSPLTPQTPKSRSRFSHSVSTTKSVTSYSTMPSSKQGKTVHPSKSSPSHSPRSRYLFSDVAAPLRNSTSSNSKGRNDAKQLQASTGSRGSGYKGTQIKNKSPRAKEKKGPVQKPSQCQHAVLMKEATCCVDVKSLPGFWHFVNSLVEEVTSQALSEGAEMSPITLSLPHAGDDDDAGDGVGGDDDNVDNDVNIDNGSDADAEELSDEVYNWFADKIVHRVFFTVLESLETKGDEGELADGVSDHGAGVGKGNVDNEITGLVSRMNDGGENSTHQSSLATSSQANIGMIKQTCHSLPDENSQTTGFKSTSTPNTLVCQKCVNQTTTSISGTTTLPKATATRTHSLNKTVSFDDSNQDRVVRTGSEGDLSRWRSPSRQHLHHQHHNHLHHRHQRSSSGSYHFSGLLSSPSSSSAYHPHNRHHHHHHQEHLHHHQLLHHERLSASTWSVSSGGSNGGSQDFLDLGGSSSNLDFTYHYPMIAGNHSFSNSSNVSSSSLLQRQKRLTKSATDLQRWGSLTSIDCSCVGGGSGVLGSRGSSPSGSCHNLKSGDYLPTTGRSSSGGAGGLRQLTSVMAMVGSANNATSRNTNRGISLANADSTSRGSLVDSGRFSDSGYAPAVSAAVAASAMTVTGVYSGGRRSSLTNIAVVEGHHHHQLCRTSSNADGESAADDSDSRAAGVTTDPLLYEAAVSIVNQVFNSISDTLDMEIMKASDNPSEPDALYPGAIYRTGQYHNIFSSSCQTTASSPSSMRRSHHHHHHHHHQHHHRSVSPSISVFSRKPMSRESLTNAFLKVDSQPSVQNYERRSSEPCHTSVQLSLEVFNKNRYNYKPTEEPQQTACTDDDIGRMGSRISWRRGSFDNNFSFDGSRNGNMSGFKDPILSRFAEELMKADTSVPELVIVGSNPSSCTTGSRRSSFSGFRDTTLANLESELLNTSFTSMISLPLSQSPRSVSGCSSQAVAAKGNNSTTNNNHNSSGSRPRSWDQQQQQAYQQLQSDSSDTEHWFLPPRHVGEEFQLEFTRQNSQGGQDEVQDLASFFAGCVVQEAVCVIKSDPGFQTDDEMAIGLYAENLTDQILRDAFFSARSNSDGDLDFQKSPGLRSAVDQCHNSHRLDGGAGNEDGGIDEKSKQNKPRDNESSESRLIDKAETGDGKRNLEPYHGEGARPKVRTMSSSSTRTHVGGRISSCANAKPPSSALPAPAIRKHARAQSSRDNSRVSKKIDDMSHPKSKPGDTESLSFSRKSTESRTKTTGQTVDAAKAATYSSPLAAHHHHERPCHPAQQMNQRKHFHHHQSDLGSTSLASSASSDKNRSTAGSGKSFSQRDNSTSARSVDKQQQPGMKEKRNKMPSSASHSLGAVAKRQQSSLSVSIQKAQEKSAKSQTKFLQPISTTSVSASSVTPHGSGRDNAAGKLSNYSSRARDSRLGTGRTSSVPGNSGSHVASVGRQGDQPHAQSIPIGNSQGHREQRRRNDSEASSSSYSYQESDLSSSSSRESGDKRKKKFTRQDALPSFLPQCKKSGASTVRRTSLKGNAARASGSHHGPSSQDVGRVEGVEPSEELSVEPSVELDDATIDTFADGLSERIVAEVLQEINWLPWWKWLPTRYRAISTKLAPWDSESGRHDNHGQFDFLVKWMVASLLHCPSLVLVTTHDSHQTDKMEEASRLVQLMSAQSVQFVASAIRKYFLLYNRDSITATTTDMTNSTANSTTDHAGAPPSSADDVVTTKSKLSSHRKSHKGAEEDKTPMLSSSPIQSSLPSPPSPSTATSAAAAATSLSPPPPSSLSPSSSPSLPALPGPSLFHFLLDLLCQNQQDQTRCVPTTD